MIGQHDADEREMGVLVGCCRMLCSLDYEDIQHKIAESRIFLSSEKMAR